MKYISNSEPFIFTAEQQVNNFFELISENKGKNFFAWINFMEVHGPYLGLYNANIIERYHMYSVVQKRPFSNSKKYFSWNKHFYTQGLKIVDGIIGKLINFLDTKKMLNNTLIIITSDHGEEFLEHGEYDHKPKPYDEIIRIPLIIYKKGERFSKIEKKAEAEKLVSLVDLAPSILNYLFNSYPQLFMGEPVILGGSAKREYILSEGYQKKDDQFHRHDPKKEGIRNWCIRTKDWKYMELNGNKMVFDLLKDPKEQTPFSLNHYFLSSMSEYINELHRKEMKHKIKTLYYKH